MNLILHLNFPRVTRLWGDYQARFLLAATVLTFLILPQALRAQGTYVQTNLVSDGFVPAQTIDANLKNPWGLVQSATSLCELLMLGTMLRRRTVGVKLGLGRAGVSAS